MEDLLLLTFMLSLVIGLPVGIGWVIYDYEHNTTLPTSVSRDGKTTTIKCPEKYHIDSDSTIDYARCRMD